MEFCVLLLLTPTLDAKGALATTSTVANRWLAAMVITFLDKSDVYNRMDGNKYHQHILEDRESKVIHSIIYIYVIYNEIIMRKNTSSIKQKSSGTPSIRRKSRSIYPPP